jgi:hypothetical protein
MKNYISLLTMAAIFLVISCKKNDDTGSTSTTPTTNTVPAVYSKIYGATSVTSDGTFVTIKTNGMPDHKSIYYATSNSLYQTFSGTTFGGSTFTKNPNAIASQNFTFKIPLNP